MTPAHAPRRSKATWALIALGGAVVVAGLAFGVYAVLHSRYFAASTVTVTGQRHESAAQVERAAGLEGAPAMIDVNTGSIQRQVEAAFPWVRTVTVTQRWPHTVSIALTERTPVATVAGQGTTMVLVDRNGRRLGAPGAGQVLPRLEYPAPGAHHDTVHGTLADTAAPGLVVAATLPPAFAAQVAVVQVDDKGWVTLHLATPVTFLLGPATDLGAKFEDVAAVIARTTLHAGDVVDVSVPQAMTVSGP